MAKISVNQNKLTTIQVVLLATGSMIGSGWLFAPYYGFQTASIGVLLSWIITMILTLIIGLAFTEVSSLLPIVGGVSRFIGITHNKSLAFIFISLSFISYVVYLPLEAQSAIQYLSYWIPSLVSHEGTNIVLSKHGIFIAILIMLMITWLNTLFVSRMAVTNFWVSIWKLIVPLLVALIIIFGYGHWNNISVHYHNSGLSYENILLAITSSGLAFAFTGFQNGLILANNANNPQKAVPHSIFTPIIFGTIVYLSLSLAFIIGVPYGQNILTTNVAPLLGLVGLFNLHIVFTLLFVDAVVAPLGTANVYTAATARILYSIGLDFLPNSILVRRNSSLAPNVALWISFILGICCLLPFPTWSQLVDFLSSVMVFTYIAGPVALIVLRQEAPDNYRSFKVPMYMLTGYVGFACCGLFIYWSGLKNLIYLLVLFASLSMIYIAYNRKNILHTIKDFQILILYLISLTIISYLHSKHFITFPIDNYLVIITSLLFCKLVVASKLSTNDIKLNLARLNHEITIDQNDK